MRTAHHAIRRRLGALATVAVTLVATGAAASTASAGDYYCYQNTLLCAASPGNQTFRAPWAHTLIKNEVWGNGLSSGVCAGAADTSFFFYGSYICGSSYAYHPYGNS